MWVKYDDNYEVSYDGHIRNSRTKRILHEYVGKMDIFEPNSPVRPD